MTRMILFMRANFFLIYFLVFLRSEARTLLEKQHEQKVVKSGPGRPVPGPPAPESASPSNQERLKRHAHLPPPAPKHGPKIVQVTSSSHGRESSELLITITSNVISDNELLILLVPSTSSDNQERIVQHGHLTPPPPKPADGQREIIITSSTTTNDDQNSNYMGREGRILLPPSLNHDAPIGELSSTRHGRGHGLEPHKYPISSLPLQASY